MKQQTIHTKFVVNKHLNAFINDLRIDAILEDYADNAVFYSPNAVINGREEIRGFFTSFINGMPDGAGENFQMHRQETLGDVAYIVWSVENQVALGTDTFIVHDGKIVQQTFAMHIA